MSIAVSSQKLSFGTQGDDVTRLQQALEALGRTLPPSETDENTFGPATAAVLKAVQAQLKKIGIEAELQPLDGSTSLKRRTDGDFDMVVDLRGGTLDKPSVIAQSTFRTGGVFAKSAGVNDPELDKLIDAQGNETDTKKRGEMFQQIQRVMPRPLAVVLVYLILLIALSVLVYSEAPQAAQPELEAEKLTQTLSEN